MKKSAAIIGALLLAAPLLHGQETQPSPPMTPMLTPTMTPVGPPTTNPTTSAPAPGIPEGSMVPIANLPPANPGTPPVPDSPPLMEAPPAAAMPALEIPQAQPPLPPPPPAPETAPAQKPMEMPEFASIAGWLNSEPLTKASLKGKIVLVDFWTYSCVNCLRTVPYLKDWYKKYKDRGFVIVGVHSPEFEFEKDPNNIKAAVQKLGLTYPIAMDNQMATWAAFKNNVWPAHYFVDANGKVRHIHFGEGEYDKSEEMIQKLIMERDQPKPESQPATMPASTQAESQAATQPAETQPETKPAPAGKKGRRGQAAAPETKPAAPAAKSPETKPAPLPALSKNAPNVDFSQIKSPETYLGLIRRERLVTSGRPIEMNEWMYDGKWRTEGDRIVLAEGTGKIYFRFNATKVNLVLAPTPGASRR
jgi:thiol-disulfide isomerase/thioredoxin